ncbi:MULTISPECIES: sulfate ABC transporter permease subunit CysT [Saccharibacillus]|uniref:Sulfate transport system permease protein CysT n=1 Tax=Saccharibacillus brassicae TaxID=2583377 RepID=A0A4Y6UZ60_SACBS|nr:MULTISPECIES: sulfate ABC transporter permease subunit CysT [Saccharibacillus]MWJ29528.1 sulfate ABC transporter permease subunit CysT [Saccharibacillus sp. WB 17]QDH21880.1 sulfate ABC transporter permease subunit CysT [Saccharibacillus brassicae]
MGSVKLFRQKNRVIPGFGLSMGITISMLGLIVMIPLLSIFVVLSGVGPAELWQSIRDPQAVAAYKVSLLCALSAALINAVFGTILAWILVRYRFPGRRILDGLIELPFALPTAVAGIALTTLYADSGWIGSLLLPLGIKVAYTPIGITIALIFIGIPFVVRSIQPVLEKLDASYEEAAAILGASPVRIFRKVVFPEIRPALLTGFGLAFARGLGEYGSVIFIAGNIPYETQILPLIVMSKLEQFNYGAAASIALVMIVFSFLILFAINLVQSRLDYAAKGAE